LTGFSPKDDREVLLTFLSHEHVKNYFVSLPGRRVKCEQEFVSGSGVLYRIDRLVLDADLVTVVDFKTGNDDREEEYREQVRNYLALVKEVFPGRRVQGVLAYVDLCQVRIVQ
jgi:ATP-dependent exoDNAse (exonuclease V) beta subunit